MAPDTGDTGAIRELFAQFAATFEDLPLYGRLAEGCATDPEVAAILTAAQPGQQRPVLLFAAVHDQILREPDLPLAAWYGSVTPPAELAAGDPWPAFRRLVLERRDELTEVVATRSTQTNEVNRAVLVAVLLAAACADVADAPVRLVELGASAGLLLFADRYRIDVGGRVVGDPDSAVHLAGAVRGPEHPDLTAFPPSIVDRVGIDRDPVSVDDPVRVRWLEACLWPDQPWRIERFRAAVAQLRTDELTLVAGDMIERLGEVAAPGGIPDRRGADAAHLVVLNVWALTYVERSRRPEVLEGLDRLARGYEAVSWVGAEPPGGVPGVDPPRSRPGAPAVGRTPSEASERAQADTVLSLYRWRSGDRLAPVAPGLAHHHGEWVSCGDRPTSARPSG